MPYLEIQKRNVGADDSARPVEMPNVTGLSVIETKKILKELGLEVEVIGEENEESIIVEQLPKKGIQINSGTKVSVYTQ